MFASNTTNVNEQPDAQFNYVTMLLHGDGTNGAQNNTFTDSSTNNFTITRNGNTTQGTFSPYGSNWSNYFDGNGDEVRFGSASDWTFLSNGLSDWTVEFWIFTQSSSGQAVLDTSNGNGNNTGFFIYLFETGTTFSVDTFPTSGGSNFRLLSTSGALPLNQWTHIAATYNKTTKLRKLYVNGVLNATLDTTGFTFSTSTPAKTLSVSWSTVSLNGNLSNVRIVKDSVVYTSDFTPSTAPLTAITGTQLLTCQSNRFIDNSSNAFASTVNGNTSVQRFSPFAPTAPYAAGTDGGSGYFDGTGDYLASASIGAISGDFTIECWAYISGAGDQALFGMGTAAVSGGFFVRYETSTSLLNFYTTTDNTFSVSLNKNSWNHIAFTRQSNSVKCWVNGTQVGSAVTISDSFSSAAFYAGAGKVGSTVPYNAMTGYISDLRVVNGSVVYTASFTPPTAPLTAITNTNLLLNYTNAGIIDNAMMNDLETVGNAQISTSVKKYGTGSLAFDGTGDGLLCKPFNQTFGKDFTVEFWIYRTGTAVEYPIDIFMPPPADTQAISMYINNSGAGSYNAVFNGGTKFTGASGSIAANEWVHVAMVRYNGVHSVYINGTANASTYTSTASYPNCQLAVGRDVAGSYSFTGYIDDVRITNGVARYTANFTPPTAAFPNN